ncbi:MAG: lasso peptide biosynthesis B2 protein [Candidatus Poribacteria bacterium]|nr:lasso peptide biosynthesis B2 protein [Candidatus Poribacteria bacterium]
MKRLATIFISIQAVFWDLNLSRKAKRTKLKQLTQLQRTLWRMNRPTEEVIKLLSAIYSWLEKKEKCLILSIVTASTLINFSSIEECEIVIAVKPFDFAAHAWVEVDGKTIPPSEVIADYREIIRIRFNKNGSMVVAQNRGTSHST